MDFENLPENLSRVEASEYLWNRYRIKLAPSTLAKMASLGGGPKYRRSGHAVAYPVNALDSYADEYLTPAAATTAEHAEHVAA